MQVDIPGSLEMEVHLDVILLQVWHIDRCQFFKFGFKKKRINILLNKDVGMQPVPSPFSLRLPPGPICKCDKGLDKIQLKMCILRQFFKNPRDLKFQFFVVGK
jgi:hypothetical protein